MHRSKDQLIELLAGIARNGLGREAEDEAREAAGELYERARHDLGARILPLVKELHETRDITMFTGKVSPWIAQPEPEYQVIDSAALLTHAWRRLGQDAGQITADELRVTRDCILVAAAALPADDQARLPGPLRLRLRRETPGRSPS